ncbi:site-specific integrase [Nonomuraea sp. NPDC001831]|uniref:site-specific integrase n=1 Tax=Nonomuraea sp. NPDC001831 TaxID=3364340 RepID=UPI00367DB574
MDAPERLPARTPALPLPDEHLLEGRTARLVEEGLAANTRLAYARRDFGAYATWCASTGRTLLPATSATLANYVAHLAAQHYAPSTIDRALACVLAAHDQRPARQTRHHRGPAGPARLPPRARPAGPPPPQVPADHRRPAARDGRRPARRHPRRTP